jgi:hypothetical protein
VLTILKLKGKKNPGFSNTNGNPSPRFSEIVSGGGAGTLISGGKKLGVTGVQKKLIQKMNKTHLPAANNKQGAGDFKIGQVIHIPLHIRQGRPIAGSKSCFQHLLGLLLTLCL